MLRLALPLAALALTAAPAAAAIYSAKPAAAVSDSRVIARTIVWTCGPEACVGSTEHSRPLVICQGLAKKAGRIDSFTVNGQAMSQDELERCNASARGDRNRAVATSR